MFAFVISHGSERVLSFPRSNSEARFRAAQESRKHLERQVKMEEYQERRDLEWLILIYVDI